MNSKWFDRTDFSYLRIVKYRSISDHEITKEVDIADLDYICRLAGRIEQIPPDGDMMKSFADSAEYLELFFYSGDEVRNVELIQHGFKTPSTGFNIRNELEKELYSEIDGLLFPQIGKILPKVKEVPLYFDNFTIRYKGSNFLDFAPVTVSFHIDGFSISFEEGNGQSNTREIEIRSGQLPPQPHKVQLSGSAIVILTFHSKEDLRIYPDYFQVVNA